MQRTSLIGSHLFKFLCLSLVVLFGQSLFAQESQIKETVEPVFRVPKIKKFTGRSHEVQPVTSSPNSGSPTFQSAAALKTDQNAAMLVAPEAAKPAARLADARSSAMVPDKIATDLVPELNAAETARHPLDRAIDIANRGLANMQANIHDYTAIMVKRERVNNQLSEPMFMKIKIRNPRKTSTADVPFSIYMKFVKPRSVVGREVIWVEGQNNSNLIVHDTNPLVRFKNLYLDPNGFLAMKGNRYPIYEAGLERLVIKLIEKAERDRAAGVCDVKYQPGAKINKRPCTLIEVTHHKRCAPYEFHVAKVYIDDEYQIPVRFAAYDWPVGNQKPKLLEEYTYVNVSLNVGLTDADFDIANRNYNFAK